MKMNRQTACIAGIFYCMLATFASADTYRVGVDDQLSLQVAVWDEINATVIEMPALSGVYRVGAGGQIAVPLAGSLAATDLSAPDIGANVEAALAAYIGIGQTVKVAVSVESYAPVYVAGQVQSPGSYDYMPDLTVLKAVTLAGGIAAVKPLAGEERNFLSARSTIGVLQRELMYLTAKRQRLMAEMDGSATFDNHDGALDPAAWASEDEILRARNARYDHELTSLARARVSLQDAMGVLKDKLATNQSQLEAGQAELQREQDLVDRGLVAPVRVFERLSYVNDLESRLLDIERSLLSAQQEIQDVQRSEGLLLALRNEETAETLQQVNAKIAEVEAQLAGQHDLLAAAAGQHASQMPIMDQRAAEPSYVITRTRGDVGTFMANPTTALMPSDVVEIIFDEATTTDPSN